MERWLEPDGHDIPPITFSFNSAPLFSAHGIDAKRLTFGEVNVGHSAAAAPPATAPGGPTCAAGRRGPPPRRPPARSGRTRGRARSPGARRSPTGSHSLGHLHLCALNGCTWQDVRELLGDGDLKKSPQELSKSPTMGSARLSRVFRFASQPRRLERVKPPRSPPSHTSANLWRSGPPHLKRT